MFGLLLGLLFRVPRLEAAAGSPPSGRLAAALAPVGISEAFVNHVRDRVTPGTSALFLISSASAEHRVVDALDGSLFGEPIRTRLSIAEDDDAGDRGSPQATPGVEE